MPGAGRGNLDAGTGGLEVEKRVDQVVVDLTFSQTKTRPHFVGTGPNH